MTGQSKEPLEQELRYSPVLVTKNGKYYFHIRELSLVSKGDSIESAYKNLLKDQEDRIQALKEVDGETNWPLPSSLSRPAPEFSLEKNKFKILISLIKFSVITLIIAFALQFAAQGIFSYIRNSINMEIVAAKNKIKAHLTNPQKVSRNNQTLITGIGNYQPAITKLLNLSCVTEKNHVEQQPGNEGNK